MIFFKKRPTEVPPITQRKIEGFIFVEKMGEKKLLSIPEFESLTKAAFIPVLDFQDFSVYRDVADRIEKLKKKGELTQEQLWLGSYYKNEMLSLFFPDVIVRWIDDSLGWGVFAAKAFKKMEFIAEYCGKVRRRKRADRHNAYCFEYVGAPHVPTPYTIDAQDQGGIARFINHSAQPNLRSVLATVDGISHVILIVDRPISKGTQLLYDYGSDYWHHRTKPRGLTDDASLN